MITAAPVVADGVLATHPIISAVPFFVPTFIVVAVIAVVIWRDRRRGDDAPDERPSEGRDAGPAQEPDEGRREP
ncbi:hypothetical protein [Actinomadura bangladeshensis]|uniref:Uncharacterized protein n=1 Tax=Actinomadura bangladeshensis TaxID=453573 RepID=A0A6L9QD21_9ACTN|nr:hypothetical protein [Actinomadura bangladeshensis]NEA22948.1 hypothetical protein [Actinomadura bangladeshensis]